MKDRRKREFLSWSRFFWCTIFVVISCVFFTGFTFSTFRLILGGTFQPVLVSTWRTPAMRAISGESAAAPALSAQETVVFPDQALIFLIHPPSARLFTKKDLDCVYVSADSSQPHTKLKPVIIDGDGEGQIARCPLAPRGDSVSVALKTNGHLSAGPTYRWDFLAYDTVIDRDNSTVVFVKGLNLRPERVANPSRFECVYGWNFTKPKFILRSDVLSVAQEIVRCRTPLSVLNGSQRILNSIKVSVRIKGKGTVPSIAHPKPLPEPDPARHEMCVCTMVRNQARFLREWIMYHAQIGVNRWFIYDNNSDDDIDQVINSLEDANFNVSRHMWPWIKTQEAGFAHCAIRARDSCEWVGFIDVDEFFHLPSGLHLHGILKNQTKSKRVGEIRTPCYSFGPSGLKNAPSRGVTVGYTCRMAKPERHKSIIRPDALNSTLINVVHHFHLSDGFEFIDVNRSMMVINHYKYQVWEVFKEKFYRRVATYVADWQDEQNVGSKDRAPGLGTRPIKPSDWSTQFCEVTDTGLRDQVLKIFKRPQSQRLPWQKKEEDEQQKNEFLIESNRKIRRRRYHRGLLTYNSLSAYLLPQKKSPLHFPVEEEKRFVFSIPRKPQELSMAREEQKQSQQNQNHTPKQPPRSQNGGSSDTMFSPRFRSVAAMAGWDEEAILIASLVVEDTPDREDKQKKRSDLLFKTPPTNSRRKRRAQRRSPASTPVPVLDLDEKETAKEECEKKKAGEKIDLNGEKKTEDEKTARADGSCSSSALPCMDRLREELSCAICLEICFEPSTTPCGHSFCKKCLRSAADKCGKRCPKCRQLISNGRSCTVNTVLWNTIQLLFPAEVEARKAAGTSSSREAGRKSPEKVSTSSNLRNQSIQVSGVLSRRDLRARRRAAVLSQDEDAALALRLQRDVSARRRDINARQRAAVLSQDEDAALALRLQREEFMEAFRGNPEQEAIGSIAVARANLRAMASRAISLRVRGRPI
ncbi:glycosyltransferase family 92 protein RCOM_0530710 [Malania oleifera]|uniref:glycosyltransferase family 92 protein RCOM_0530710 n=1 Tax=Malania oleifera TaxID=397392 RepID=UPI0025AE4DAE|nr:glycosyltransferase family 92 protein RCOM_0530710 [Malania oleifera]